MTACNVVGLPGLPSPRCFVHDNDAPCPAEGLPAAAHPIHVFSEPDQIQAVEAARDISRGSRPIRVHKGTEGETGHITAAGKDCWCQPVTIPAG